MFKDGKIFGKINIIDFTVVVVVVLLIACAFLKFSKFDKKSDDTTLSQTIEYKMIVKGIRNYTLDAFEVGDGVYDSQSKVGIGTIKNIETTLSDSYENLITGEVELLENPYRYDVVFTIETDGVVTSEAYYANKSIELKVNSTKAIETKYAKTTGTITDITLK